MRGLRRFVYPVFIGLVVIYLVVPLAIVVPMSFSEAKTLQFPPRGFTLEWYEAAFTDEKWSGHLVTSFVVAMLTVLTTTILGTLAAFGLVRGRFPGRNIANAMVISPLIVPTVITAVALFGWFSGWRLVGSIPTVVAGHTVLGLPFVVIAVSAGLQTIDPALERSARTLGASPFRSVWHVTLPLLRPSIAVGAVLAFITSWDEVVISLFLTSPTLKTLPVVVWQQINESIDPTVAAVSTLLIVVTTIALVSIAAIQRSAGESA